MKTALDFYERGKQKEINADEYDRRVDGSPTDSAAYANGKGSFYRKL